jgi:replicative DNA helicase
MSDVLERTGLPGDTEAERYVLSNVLHSHAEFRTVAALFDAADLTTEAHRRVWLAMQALDERGDPIDTLMVYRELEQRKQIESVGGLTFLTNLDAPKIISLDSYCRRIKELSVKRQMLVKSREILDAVALGQKTTEEAFEGLRTTIDGLERQKTDRSSLLSLAQVLENAGGLNAIASKPQSGIPYPWRLLNWLTAGMHPGQLILLAARPGIGKSAAALQIAIHASRKGHSGALFSLEMSGRELLIRALCGASGIDSTSVRNGTLTQDERFSLLAAAGEISDLPMRVDDSTGVTIPAMRAALAKHRQQARLDFAVLDYLQLCETVGKVENRVQAIGQISRGLKLLAREFEIPILALSQLSRASAKENRQPELMDLRDSGSIEQDADTVMFLHATADAERAPYDPIHTSLLVKKQRGGPIGRVELSFIPRTCMFHEVEREGAAA